MRRIEYSSVQGSLQHSGAINRTTTQKHVRKPRGSEEEQEQESYSKDLKAPAAVVDGGGGGSSAALLPLLRRHRYHFRYHYSRRYDTFVSNNAKS